MIKTGSIYSRKSGFLANNSSSFLTGSIKNCLKSTSDERDTPHSSVVIDANQDGKENSNQLQKVSYQEEQSSPFDSLAPFQRRTAEGEPKKRKKGNKNPMACMHQIFLSLRQLQANERQRSGLKILSEAENRLLSFERALLQE